MQPDNTAWLAAVWGGMRETQKEAFRQALEKKKLEIEQQKSAADWEAMRQDLALRKSGQQFGEQRALKAEQRAETEQQLHQQSAQLEKAQFEFGKESSKKQQELAQKELEMRQKESEMRQKESEQKIKADEQTMRFTEDEWNFKKRLNEFQFDTMQFDQQVKKYEFQKKERTEKENKILEDAERQNIAGVDKETWDNFDNNKKASLFTQGLQKKSNEELVISLIKSGVITNLDWAVMQKMTPDKQREYIMNKVAEAQTLAKKKVDIEELKVKAQEEQKIKQTAETERKNREVDVSKAVDKASDLIVAASKAFNPEEKQRLVDMAIAILSAYPDSPIAKSIIDSFGGITNTKSNQGGAGGQGEAGGQTKSSEEIIGVK